MGYKLFNGTILLLAMIAAITSCKKASTPATPAALYEAQTNYLYGTDTNQQILDFYLPAGRDTNNTPVAILLHGGAWVQGNKSDWDVVGLDSFFIQNGIAVVNMNYRLDGTYPYPAPLTDINMVMDLIKQKATDWQVNPNKVFLVGRSSGAHLAMLYAYSRNTDKRIKAVVECCGPFNLADTSVVNESLGANVTVWLGNYTNNQQLWHDASPSSYMQNAVPTVILQGLADPLVLPVQSRMLQDSLISRNVPCLYIGWENSTHGWNLQLWPLCKDQVVAWVKNQI